MSFERLEFTRSWRDPDAFPAYEPDEGKVREDLQSLHDETKEVLNRLIETLNSVSAAAELPIAPVEGLDAATVQSAIEEVFAAVTEAASGQIVKGTVTKEKLAQDVIDRIYGGSVRISLDAPTGNDDLPIGQLWMCPALEPLDLSEGVWRSEGGTAEGMTFFPGATEDQVKAVFTLESAGSPGDAVRVFLECTASDEIGELSVQINTSNTDVAEDCIYEGHLDGAGVLEVMVSGAVPADAEDPWIRIDRVYVLDTTALEQRYGGAPYGEWDPVLRAPEARRPASVWTKTADGVWEQIFCDTVPVGRGGTGHAHLPGGAIAYGAGTAPMGMLSPVEGGIVQFRGGKPTAVAPEHLAVQGGYLRVMSGSYTGTGGNADRSEQLPLTPLMLLVWREDGTGDTACLANGGRDTGIYEFYDGVIVSYEAWVRLQGDSLFFSNEHRGNKQSLMESQHMNAKDVKYQWLAVY